MNNSLVEFLKYLLAESELADVDLQSLSTVKICKMQCLAEGCLVVHLVTPHILDLGLQIGIEQLLENHLQISEVIIKQYHEDTEIDYDTFIAGIPQWLLRHADKNQSLLATVLQNTQYSITENMELICQLPTGTEQIIENKKSWIHSFWRQYAPLDLELKLVSDEAELEERLERTINLLADTRETVLAEHQCCHHHHHTEPIQPIKNKYKRVKNRNSDQVIWGRTGKELPLISISDIDNETDRALFKGQVFDFESRNLRSGNQMIKFAVTDMTGSIECVLFVDPETGQELEEKIKNQYLQITADISFDHRFTNDYQAKVTCIERAVKPQKRQDTYADKRVELHIHSKMSAKDAISDPARIITRAHEFGHHAIALTDHGVVQGFPEAANAVAKINKNGGELKLIYGVEAYLLDDGLDCISYLCEEVDLSEGLVLLDIHTCGSRPARGAVSSVDLYKLSAEKLKLFLSADNRSDDGIDELKASITHDSYRLRSQAEAEAICERLHSGETQEDIANNPEVVDVLYSIQSDIASKPVIIAGGLSKLNYLRYEGFRIADNAPTIKFNPAVIDWQVLADHASVSDELTDKSSILTCFVKNCAEWGIQLNTPLVQLNKLVDWKSFNQLRDEKKRTNHIILLAEDNLGLYNLYRMVSDAHLKYFYYKPRTPRSILKYFGAGIIVGAACVYGEVFMSILDAYQRAGSDYAKACQLLDDERLKRVAQFYDYLEVQPLGNNRFLTRTEGSGVANDIDLQNLNRLVIKLGELVDRPVCATSDSHFLEPEDDVYRRILLTDMNFDDADDSPDLYFRTTDEMYREFAYLPSEQCDQVILSNPQAIAARVQKNMKPFPDGSFPPIISSAAREIEDLTMATAHQIYGRDGVLPDIVEARVKRELSSIIDNGFAIMYYIAHKLVKQSNDDGYVVGSRGSVGSSLVATLCGITEVNPLLPHYICPQCHYFEADESGTYGSGFDLPAKKCPHCGADLKREGQDIPFETFLGFDGDKQPDIDLNFSGFYQATAHRFIEDMFGKSHTYRAGTISGYAEKNSVAMVRDYTERTQQHWGGTEIKRLAHGLQGIKRTTGQHPGGIVVVPKEREIYDFTPIQHPADKRDSGIITTHFDFNAMHDTILKLDVLGHDNPSMLKMLGDQTGVNIADIPIPDPKVMELFKSTAAIGIDPEESTIGSATIGLPELGTFMAREMISETKPQRFYDLVQLSGLSHGTDVWSGNAQELIRNGTCTINEVIGCRDSIMTYLIYRGLPKKAAFDIMEKVRKGKGLSAEHEQMMRDHNVDDWYIESCKKIKYMFPKAHAVAYIMSALQIAWFKVYHPESYYCAFFTIRAVNDFSSDEMCLSPDKIRIKRQEQRKDFKKMSKPDQKKFFVLELVEEMQHRGINFLPLDLFESRATEFYSPEPGWIRPPLSTIPGISASIAEAIVRAREEGEIPNCEILQRRAGLGKATIDALQVSGVLKDLPETAQIDLFSLL